MLAEMKFEGGRVGGAAGTFHKDPNHVLDMNEAGDVIESAFVNGKARALSGGEHSDDVVEAGFHGKSVDVEAGNHNLAGLNFAEADSALNDLHFDGLEKAAFASLFDEDLQFFGGADGVLALWLADADGAIDFVGDAVEQVDGPTKGMKEPAKWTGDDEGDFFRPGEGDAFGDEFAEDDFDNGESAEGEHEGGGMNGDEGPAGRDRGDGGAERFGERDFTDVAESKASEGDADLHAGDDAAEVGEEVFNDFGAGISLLRELADAGVAHGDHGKFSGREKRVDEDQAEDAD